MKLRGKYIIGLSNKIWWIFILTQFSCHNSDSSFIAYNRSNEFKVTIPTLDSKHFELIKENTHDGNTMYVSLHDSITVIISNRVDSIFFKNQLSEDYYIRRQNNQHGSNHDFVIELNIQILHNKIYKNSILINKLEFDGYLSGNYVNSFLYSEIDVDSYTRVEIRKEFTEFDLLKIYDWCQQFNNIKVIAIQ